MTEEQKAERAKKARERAQRWRDKVMADPETAAKARADHAKRCAESRARIRAKKGPSEPRPVGRPRKGPPTPEEIERKRQQKRAAQARYLSKPGVRDRMRIVANAWNWTNRDRKNERNVRYRIKNAEAIRLYNRTRRPGCSAPPAQPFAGSVLAASAQSPARDLLAQVTGLVPHWALDADEIVGEAMILVLEGAEPADAVKSAKAIVSRAFRAQLMSIPIEDCSWL